MKMIKLKGTKTETKEFIIDVEDKELLSAIKQRCQLKSVILNDEETEIGYWKDESSERSNFEDWHWHCISKDKKKIDLFRAIQLIEDYLEEENN
jgi:glycogen synthase